MILVIKKGNNVNMEIAEAIRSNPKLIVSGREVKEDGSTEVELIETTDFTM